MQDDVDKEEPTKAYIGHRRGTQLHVALLGRTSLRSKGLGGKRRGESFDGKSWDARIILRASFRVQDDVDKEEPTKAYIGHRRGTQLHVALLGGKRRGERRRGRLSNAREREPAG